MKKNVFWMALISLVMMTSTMFTSCSKDDDDDDASGLAGKWVLIQEEGYDVWNGSKNSYNHTYDVSDETDVLVFKKDGTFVDDNYSGKWSYEGETLNVTATNEYGNTYNKTYKVLSVTSSQLILEYSRKSAAEENYEKSTYLKVS